MTKWDEILFTCYYCKQQMNKKMFKRYSLALKTRKGKCLKCHAMKSKEYRINKAKKILGEGGDNVQGN